MFFHFLNKEGNPKVYESFEDLFNPEKNTYYSEEKAKGLTINKAIKFLKTIYCYENLSQLEICQKLIKTNVEETRYFIDKLLPHLNKDHLWYLHFFQRQGYLNNESILKFITPNNYEIYNDDFYFSFGNRTESTILSKDRYAEQIDIFNNTLNRVHEKFDSVLSKLKEQDKNKLLFTFDNIRSDKHLVYYLYFFINNQGIFYNSNTGIHENVTFYLKNKKNMKLKFFTFGVEFKIEFTIPISKTNKSQLYQIFNYTTDVCTLLPYPNKLKQEQFNNPVILGVELELSTNYTIKEIINASDDPFFLCKKDSSITGEFDNYLELVTAPSSFKYLKKQFAYWFNNLDYSRFDCSTQTNNGMHIHIGKESFLNENHIRNFCWFFNNPANLEFLVYISERGTVAGLERYSPQVNFNLLSITKRTNAFRNIKDICIRAQRNYGWRGVTFFKRENDAKTVEVRLFRGIFSFASVVKNMEFVEAVFEFTKGDKSYQHLTLSDFIEWVQKSHHNRFILLKKFIDTIDTDKYLIAAQIKDLLFLETKEEAIIQILQKAPFKITNKHLEILNNKKKRTFTLNKITGEINVILHNRSKLLDHDKSFADRYLR